jgi:adenylate cyclase
MSEALDAHHRLVRQCLRDHNGYEVKTIGDAFMVAFADPVDAVEFAAAVQVALYDYDWGTDAIDEVYRDQLEQRREENPGEVLPERMSKEEYRKWFNGLRVRVGVHFGEGEIQFDEVTKGYDYYGTVVNTAARIEDAANGGQIVVSEAVMKELDRRGVLYQYNALSLGNQALRGLELPVLLTQLQLLRFAGRTFPTLRLVGEEAWDTAIAAEISTRNSTTSSVALASDTLSQQLEIAFSLLPPGERGRLISKLCTAWRISEAEDTNKYSMILTNLAKRVASVHNTRSVKSNSQIAGSSRGSSRNVSLLHFPTSALPHVPEDSVTTSSSKGFSAP